MASGERSEVSGRRAPSRTLELIEYTIRNGNRKQRDIALVAVTKVGPGSGFTAEFLQSRGAWSREALSAVTCEPWSAPDVHDLWSKKRTDMFSRLDYKRQSARAVELMIAQMLDKSLRYPEEVFSDALSNRGYEEHGLTVERVRNLLPVLTERTYPVSIRKQAIGFVDRLGGHAEVFERSLLEVYGAREEGLSRAAGFALVRLRSPHGADVLADLIESEGHRAWPRDWGPRGNCDYPPRSERLVRALLERLDDEIPDVRGDGHRGARMPAR